MLGVEVFRICNYFNRLIWSRIKTFGKNSLFSHQKLYFWKYFSYSQNYLNLAVLFLIPWWRARVVQHTHSHFLFAHEPELNRHFIFWFNNKISNRIIIIGGDGELRGNARKTQLAFPNAFEKICQLITWERKSSKMSLWRSKIY